MLTVVPVSPGADAELPEPDPPPHAAATSAEAPAAAATAHGLDPLIRDAMSLLLCLGRAGHCVTARAPSARPGETSAAPGGPATPGHPGCRGGTRGSLLLARHRRWPAARCWR